MRTAKYNDYKLLSVVMLIFMVVIGLAIYLAFAMLPSHDHVADSWVTVDSTCDADGCRYKVCTECGEKFAEEVIPATGHTNLKTKKENEKPHSKTEGGSYENVIVCVDCGKEVDRETVWIDGKHTINRNDIETQEKILVESTCVEPGSKEVVEVCTVCDKEISRETVSIDPIGHDFKWTAYYDEKTDSYSLKGICDVDGSEATVTSANSTDFTVVNDETVAPCCARYIISCTYNGKAVQVLYYYDSGHNHIVEYYEDKDSLYNPQPVYITLPDPKVDALYGEYYDIDETPYITPYNVGNSVWSEYGFSYGAFKCHACEEYECNACVENGHYIIVKIYSAKYDTRLNQDENTNN